MTLQSEIGHSLCRVLNCAATLKSNAVRQETIEEVLKELENWNTIDIRKLIASKSAPEDADKLDWRPIFNSFKYLIGQFETFLATASELISESTGPFEADTSCTTLGKAGLVLYGNASSKLVRMAQKVSKRRWNIIEGIGTRCGRGQYGVEK